MDSISELYFELMKAINLGFSVKISKADDGLVDIELSDGGNAGQSVDKCQQIHSTEYRKAGREIRRMVRLAHELPTPVR